VGSTACAGVCPHGTHAPAGSSNCESCIAGRVDYDSDPSTPCIDCEAGRFSEAVGAAVCAGLCPHGTYAPAGSLNATSCTSCIAGRADSDSDAGTPCSDCDAGRFSEAVGATSCTECPIGTLAPVGSSDATSCEAVEWLRAHEVTLAQLQARLQPHDPAKFCGDDKSWTDPDAEVKFTGLTQTLGQL
jgi:hypothetical protein